jgi:L-threonylcarbamoyladenylate synthase
VAAIVLPIERKDALRRALTLLQQGEAIAFPTDTVYGVGAAGLNGAAVARLFTVKKRPREQAIPLLLWDAAELREVCPAVPPAARDLGARYWPGALTLVVPAAAHLPAELLAGGTTVAVRVPQHAWLRELIRLLGQPLAATSANLHGGANPATAEAVAEQLGARLPLIVDGGPTPGDVPSTIVDVTGPQPKVLRAGALVVEF